MTDTTKPIPAVIQIPSGWAKLHGDKPMKLGDRWLSFFNGPKPFWKPVDPIYVGKTASILPMVIFKLKPKQPHRKSTPPVPKCP